jgi:hypothetical protein
MKTTKSKSVGPYAHLKGKNVIVRSVTMIYTGKLEAVYRQELVLSDAAWIADAGRWVSAVRDGTYAEVEPYPDGKIVLGRGAIADVSAAGGALPRSQK